MILARNARIGRLELDIIARRGDLLIICEVRSRSTRSLLSPARSFDAAKIARVRRAALRWRRRAGLDHLGLRLDAAAVRVDPIAGDAWVEYYPGAL